MNKEKDKNQTKEKKVAKDKEPKIEALKEFEETYSTLNLNRLSFSDIVEEIQKKAVEKYIQKFSEKPSTGSVNNCRGKWNELVFIMAAHQSIQQSTENLYVVKMGSETSINFWEIYTKESRQRYENLIRIFKERQEPIFIRCSTPDFVVNITSGQELDKYWQIYEEITEPDLKGKAVSPNENFGNDNLDL